MRSRVSCTVLAVGAALLGSAVPAGAAPALASATAAASVSALLLAQRPDRRRRLRRRPRVQRRTARARLRAHRRRRRVPVGRRGRELGAAARLHRLQRLERARRGVHRRRPRTNAGKVWLATGEYTQPWASPPDGEVLRSADQGRTWQVSDLPIQLAANQDGRDMGERLAVDPNDDQVLYLASPANGLWRSRRRRRDLGAGRHLPGDQHPGRHRPVLRDLRRRPAAAAARPTQDDLRRRRHRRRRVRVHRRGRDLAADPRRADRDGTAARRDGRERHLLRRLRQRAGPERDDRRQRLEVRPAAPAAWTNITPAEAGRGREPVLRLLRARR